MGAIENFRIVNNDYSRYSSYPDIPIATLEFDTKQVDSFELLSPQSQNAAKLLDYLHNIKRTVGHSESLEAINATTEALVTTLDFSQAGLRNFLGVDAMISAAKQAKALARDAENDYTATTMKSGQAETKFIDRVEEEELYGDNNTRELFKRITSYGTSYASGSLGVDTRVVSRGNRSLIDYLRNDQSESVSIHFGDREDEIAMTVIFSPNYTRVSFQGKTPWIGHYGKSVLIDEVRYYTQDGTQMSPDDVAKFDLPRARRLTKV